MKTALSLVLAISASFLSLRAQDSAALRAVAKSERVAFAQSCFWTGEMRLGQIDGVVRTEAGFIQGREVTLVTYDPARIPLEKLASEAKQAGVADRIHLRAGNYHSGSAIGGVTIGLPLDGSYRAAPASDQKKQLAGTPYARLKLTPEQATKVNAFVLVDPVRAREWLTTSQREELAATK